MNLKNSFKQISCNHKIHAEEVVKGLWEKEKGKKSKSKKPLVVKEQGGLFGE